MERYEKPKPWAGKSWSEMSVEEHLYAAGDLFEKHRTDQVNGLHKDLIEARAHTEAATALASRPRDLSGLGPLA